MKKNLLKALFAVGLFVATNSINAQCSLDQVGAVNYSVTSQYSDIAVAPNNALYTISYNSGASGKIYLHRAATPTSSWSPVAVLGTTLAIKPVVSVSKTGKVYIVIKDEGAGQVGKVYYESAGSFVQLGTAFSGSNKVSDLSIAFNSLGEEYVAYTDITNGNLSTVKKWNGSAWVAVGTGIASSGAAYYNSLIIDKTDSPVLAFEDMSAGNKVTIMKFNGATWNSMTSIGTNPTNSKLKLGQNGDYYVGYTESTGNVVVQRYNGSVWTALGSPVTAMSFGANLFDLELDPNDMPYFICQNNTSYWAAGFKYTGVPTWVNVIGGNLSGVTSVNLNMAIDYTGSPYFFYVDQPGNNGLNVKTISSPIFISSQPLSVSRCNGQSGSFSVGTVGGAPTGYQWQTLGAGTFTNSSAPYTNVTTANLAFTANTSMNQNQVRCVVNVGCKNIITNTPTLTVVTPSSNLVPTNPTCFGSCNGMITSTPSGGTGPYTFTWTPGGASTQNLSGACSGTYSLTTADVSGCTVTSTGLVVDPTPVSASPSGNMNICNGSNTSLTLTATGGTGTYTYSWAPGGSLSSTTTSVVIANPTSTQTYTVTATDALGCVATNTVMVTVNASPAVSASNITICAGGIATLNASGSAHTYTWNPGNLVGAVQNVSPGTTTTYTVVGTNTLTSCTNSTTALVTVNNNPTVNAGPSRTLTCANTSTTLAGSTTGGVSYSWTGPGIVSGASTLNPTINATGTYDLTVTSAQGCSAGPSPVTVFQDVTPPSPTATTSGTLTCSSTTASVIGGGGGTYSWSGPSIVAGAATSTPTVNLPGSYNVTVTAANGCTATANTTVTQNTIAPSPTASNSGTLTCSTTTVALTGGPAAGVTYQWSGPGFSGGTTSQNALANAAGTYSLKVTSATNGCTNTAVTSVTQNTVSPSPTASTTGTLTCTTVTVPLTGSPGTGVTYLWSGPGISGSTTTQNTSANVPGIYTLTVVSSINGCSANATTVVSQNVTPPTASATNSGTLTCTTTTMSLSGTGGGTYMWSGPGILSGGATASPVVNLPGCYNLTVTAANSCTAGASTCVSQNTIAPNVTGGVSGTLTCITSTVNATSSTTTTPVSYNWTGTGITGGATTGTITVNQAGIFSYTVTNTTTGCKTTGTRIVTQNTVSPSGVSAGIDQLITCTNPTVTLNGSVSSPTNALYNWTGGVCGSPTTSVTTACSANMYTLTATNPINGCNASDVMQVTANISIPTATLSSNSETITCTTSTVFVTSSTTVTPVSYSWSPALGIVGGSGSTNTPYFNAPGSYSLVVTDLINGCSSNISSNVVSVSQDITTPSLSISATSTSICSGNTTTLSAIGANTYLWDSGATTNTISVSPSSSTTYTVTGTGTNGCSSNMTQNVTVGSTPSASGISNSPVCSQGSIMFTNMSTTPTGIIVTALWNGPTGYSSSLMNPSISNVDLSYSGTYTLTVTNTDGCTNYTMINVTVNSTPTITVGGNLNICGGSTTSLTATGATSYTWSTGVNSNTVSVTPTVTTTYTVDGDNGNGCIGSLPVTVSIIPNKSISGVITSTTGPTGGDIIIYKYTAALSHWDSLTITPIGGTYSFNNIDSGLYVLRAIPTATNIQVTYADSSISWQNATIITHGCTNNTTQNIKLIPLEVFTPGPGILTGTVYEDYGFGQRMADGFKPLSPGGPIGGIIVKGGKNPGGQMMVQTITSTTPGSEGTYTLTGLPLNSGTDSYFILVDIPGLDTNGTYHKVITATDTVFNGLDFKVDSMYINPIGMVTGILDDNSVLDHKISLFPNPANQKVTLEYELTQSANVQIELYNMVGHKVKAITPSSFEEKNKYSHSINLEYISSGVYFVKVKINNSETTIKLIVTN